MCRFYTFQQYMNTPSFDNNIVELFEKNEHFFEEKYFFEKK